MTAIIDFFVSETSESRLWPPSIAFKSRQQQTEVSNPCWKMSRYFLWAGDWKTRELCFSFLENNMKLIGIWWGETHSTGAREVLDCSIISFDVSLHFQFTRILDLLHKSSLSSLFQIVKGYNDSTILISQNSNKKSVPTLYFQLIFILYHFINFSILAKLLHTMP